MSTDFDYRIVGTVQNSLNDSKKSATMLPRLLEPEVMNSEEEAVDYDRMDHSHVNSKYVDDFLIALDGPPKISSQPLRIFDAGTGTALIPIELMRRGLSGTVVASDLADEMLKVARKNVVSAGYQSSIELVIRDCKQLPDTDGSYDAVISNSIVHHIPDPRQVIHELWRILKPGGLFFIRDLTRPEDDEALDSLVTIYAGAANDHQRQMFRDSLHAALTVAEVQEILRELAVPSEVIRATSDRHWTICTRK